MGTMTSPAASIDLVELGRHIERTTRRTAEVRRDCVVVGLSRGWCRLRAGDEGECASASPNRVYWSGVDGPLTDADVGEMAAAARLNGATGAFVRTTPAGLAGGGAAVLARAGAERAPHVRHFSLVRRAEVMASARDTSLLVRRIEPAEVRRSMESVKAGGTAEGISAAEVIVERGWAEMYGAFCGETCVASSAILRDPQSERWVYLGWTGTDPAFRGRGAQSALIAARVSRAAELGATWCVSETNTAAEGSLRNLVRAGFAVAVEWGVFRWRDGGERVSG